MPVASPSYALLAIVVGLVLLGLGLVRHLLRRETFPLGLALLLSLAAVCCVGYVAMLTFGIRYVRFDDSSEPQPVAPLSAPQETRLIELTESDKPADMPSWVNAEPRLVGDRYEISVASDPKLTAAEAQADLAEKTHIAVRKYISDLLHDGAERVQVSRSFIAEHIETETYVEPVKLTVGDMHIAHALLVFDNSVRDEFRHQYRASLLQGRMAQAGGFAALVLALLGTLFGFLKIDTLTRGYYTGRLQLAAGALILGVVIAGLMLA